MNLHQRASGVLLHITSLPGAHGIGDFGPEAYHFADWLQACGQKIWQWLPTTPIGPGDSPYQSVSAFAGSPLMVALEPLVQRGWLGAPALPILPTLPEGGFNARHVDFGRVVPWRLTQLRGACAGFHAHATHEDREAFAQWCEAPGQTSWLDDYCLFMALESAHGGQPWWLWDEALAARKKPALKAARKAHADEITFWQFVQWCFDVQCAALKRYCNDRGIALMGDLPIFIAHHSADCWARPDLYLLDKHHQPTVVAGMGRLAFRAKRRCCAASGHRRAGAWLSRPGTCPRFLRLSVLRCRGAAAQRLVRGFFRPGAPPDPGRGLHQGTAFARATRSRAATTARPIPAPVPRPISSSSSLPRFSRSEQCQWPSGPVALPVSRIVQAEI